MALSEVLGICRCKVFDDECCVCYYGVAMCDIWYLQCTLNEQRQGVKEDVAESPVSWLAVSTGSETETHELQQFSCTHERASHVLPMLQLSVQTTGFRQ